MDHLKRNPSLRVNTTFFHTRILLGKNSDSNGFKILISMALKGFKKVLPRQKKKRSLFGVYVYFSRRDPMTKMRAGKRFALFFTRHGIRFLMSTAISNSSAFGKEEEIE